MKGGRWESRRTGGPAGGKTLEAEEGKSEVQKGGRACKTGSETETEEEAELESTRGAAARGRRKRRSLDRRRRRGLVAVAEERR